MFELSAPEKSVIAKLPVPVLGSGVIVNDAPEINAPSSTTLIFKVPFSSKSSLNESESVRVAVNDFVVVMLSVKLNESVRV